jgi:hypothetical protein
MGATKNLLRVWLVLAAVVLTVPLWLVARLEAIAGGETWLTTGFEPGKQGISLPTEIRWGSY